MRTNDANNYIVGQISRTVFGEVRRAASTKTSRSFLDRIFVSFSDLRGETVKAAKGADKLNGGIGKAEKGSQDLADGLTDAREGAASCPRGSRPSTRAPVTSRTARGRSRTARGRSPAG
ncbi:hypothetical protein SHKM778_71500 [Streptomyces sp. KM77-8]|uniref:CsbD family protein n=1 Tax=Streptomyces haneummycinicus TaxID=3074435 RepID=A0AAT9HTI4_9ACTN